MLEFQFCLNLDVGIFFENKRSNDVKGFNSVVFLIDLMSSC